MILLMPMAGLGSRFPGSTPKPLIDVGGVPMFVAAERSIGLDFAQRIFITRTEHDLTGVIHQYYPDARVIEIDYTTEGTASTLLLARDYIADEELFVANCDQIVDWNPLAALHVWQGVDGGIATFDCPEQDTKWSYAQHDLTGSVKRVAEKDPISTTATVGYYYWRRGSWFIDSAEQMIAEDDRVNGEFYTCPTFNYMIAAGGVVRIAPVRSMQGVGTPEDLEIYNQI